MSKSKRRFNDFDDDSEGGFISNHSEHLKEKRLESAIKSKNVDKLLELEENIDEDYYDDSDDNYYEYGYASEWEEYKKKNGL